MSRTWGVNFERKVRRLNEDSHWAPLPRIYDIERVSLAGRVDDFRGLRQGRNLRIKPCAAGSSNTIGLTGTSGDFDAGFDVKCGITNGLVWDFTVNTDFSQVEADEQQINLTRFSLFFPRNVTSSSRTRAFSNLAPGSLDSPPAVAAVAVAAVAAARPQICGCSSAVASGCRKTARRFRFSSERV